MVHIPVFVLIDRVKPLQVFLRVQTQIRSLLSQLIKEWFQLIRTEFLVFIDVKSVIDAIYNRVLRLLLTERRFV